MSFLICVNGVLYEERRGNTRIWTIWTIYKLVLDYLLIDLSETKGGDTYQIWWSLITIFSTKNLLGYAPFSDPHWRYTVWVAGFFCCMQISKCLRIFAWHLYTIHTSPIPRRNCEPEGPPNIYSNFNSQIDEQMSRDELYNIHIYKCVSSFPENHTICAIMYDPHYINSITVYRHKVTISWYYLFGEY